MFLLSKPLVNNPLIIGDWPFYILSVQLIGLLHIVVLCTIIIRKLNEKLKKNY